MRRLGFLIQEASYRIFAHPSVLLPHARHVDEAGGVAVRLAQQGAQHRDDLVNWLVRQQLHDPPRELLHRRRAPVTARRHTALGRQLQTGPVLATDKAPEKACRHCIPGPGCLRRSPRR